MKRGNFGQREWHRQKHGGMKMTGVLRSVLWQSYGFMRRGGRVEARKIL